jgi:ribosomal protein S18 acetylase RimI-like enzyme
MLVFFKRYRMQFDLRGQRFENLEPPAGFQLLPWRPSLIQAHAEAKFRSFRDELDANVFPCLGNESGCLRLMNEITHRSNFVPESTWLLVHNQQKSQDPLRPLLGNCGTVQGIMDGPDLGLIQNIGIVQDIRGQGLGSLIVRNALAGFQRAGAKIASLEVTSQNTGAIRLYLRLGFKIRKTVYKTVQVPNH